MKDDWNKTRGKLKEFLENYPDEWIGNGVYKHPVIGMLNMTDGLRFLNAHLNHHMNQVRQIRTIDAVDSK